MNQRIVIIGITIVILSIIIYLLKTKFYNSIEKENYQRYPNPNYLFTGYDEELLSKSNYLAYPDPGLKNFKPKKTSGLIAYCDEEIDSCITY